MEKLIILQHAFNILCIIFCLWMCFRWTTKTFADSMIKVILFLLAMIGLVLELQIKTNLN